MKKLPNKFRKWGFDWEILKREGDVALLKQSFENFSKFNVVKIQKFQERVIGGNTIPAKEGIPGQSQWGTYAWNFGKDLDLAEKRFKLLAYGKGSN